MKTPQSSEPLHDLASSAAADALFITLPQLVITDAGAPRPEARETVAGMTSVVVVTTGRLEVLQGCLDAVARYTPEHHEVVVVASGVEARTLAWLRDRAADGALTLLENPTDPGRARALNQGIEAAQGEHVALLGADARVPPHWLADLHECRRSVPSAGFVGPMSDVAEGAQRVPVTGASTSDDFAASLRERCRHRRLQVRSVGAFCMLFARALVEEIGLFDARFATGDREDEDLCLRAALLGHTNLLAGDVFVHRVGPAEDHAGDRRRLTAKWSNVEPDSPLADRLVALASEERAHDLAARGRTADAVEVLLAGIRRTPGDRRPYHTLIELLLEAKLFDQAVELATQLGDGDVTALVLAGHAHLGLGAVDRAGELARLALEREPGSALAMTLAGAVAFGRGDRDAAAADFSRAVAADPGQGEAHTNLGVLAWSAGRRDEGLALLERGFVLSPHAADLAATWYQAASAQGAWERAELVLREAHALRPSDRRLTFLLVDALMHRGEHARAMEVVEQAMADFELDDELLDAALALREAVGPRGGKGGISACLIVKNEAKNLARCLRSLAGVAGEYVVVDTGSTDRTRDIARAFGARLFEHAWTGDFADARNVSLAKATGAWILVMDADETLSQRDAESLRALVAGRETRRAAWVMVTRNYVVRTHLLGWTANDGSYADDEAGTGWFPSRKIRLFPNDARIRFENPVHELVEYSVMRAGVPIEECRVPVHHYGKLDEQREGVKNDAYYHLCKRKVADRPNDPQALRELAGQAQVLGKLDEALATWTRLAEVAPHTAVAFLNIGTLSAELGRFDEARVAARRARSLDPKLREAAYSEALCELYVGDAAKAVELLEAVCREDTRYAPAQSLLAVAACCAGQTDRGVEMIAGFRKLNPGYDASLVHLVGRIIEAGSTSRAATLLEAAQKAGVVSPELDDLWHRCAA